jgi:hypothetical protein
MASIVQQSSWDERHPTLARGLRGAVAAFYYTINGQIIVDFGRWLILYCGRVSETAMLLATLWVTGTFVAPELTNRLGATALTLSSLSLIAFSLLPEVILFSAIITTYQHWQNVYESEHRAGPVTWAVLYTLPTAMFFGMTVYTICSFVGEHGHIQQATGAALVLRCLAGWFYSLVGLIHAGINKRTPLVAEQQQSAPVVTISPEEMVDRVRGELSGLYESQLQSLWQQLAQISQQNTQLAMQLEDLKVSPVVVESETTFPPVEDETETATDTPLMDDIAAYLAEQEIETESIPVVSSESEVERPKITRKLSTKAPAKTATNNARGEARQKALRIIARNPQMKPAELAKKAGISPQYASTLLKERAS